jgi:hypothetical protein
MYESLSNSGNSPLWLNTHGLVVNYLHMRIDSQPKYYQHEEYLGEDGSQNTHWVQPKTNLSALKQQAISEITDELINGSVSTNELDPNLHQ